MVQNILYVSAEARRFVVAREVDGELYYYGSWDDVTQACEAAKEVDGKVYENV